MTTAERDARIYGDLAHLGRSPAMVAEEVGLSTRTVWQIVQMRRDALTVDEPALVAPDGEPVGEEWRATIASWGRPGLLLAANLLLLGRVRPDDQQVQQYLGMGEHRQPSPNAERTRGRRVGVPHSFPRSHWTGVGIPIAIAVQLNPRINGHDLDTLATVPKQGFATS